MEQLAKFCRDNADKWARIPTYSKIIKPSDVVNAFGYTNFMYVNAIIEATKHETTLCIKYTSDNHYVLCFCTEDLHEEDLDFHSTIEEYGEL